MPASDSGRPLPPEHHASGAAPALGDVDVALSHPDTRRRWWMQQARLAAWPPLDAVPARAMLRHYAEEFLNGRAPGVDGAAWRFYATLDSRPDLERAFVEEVARRQQLAALDGPERPVDRTPEWLDYAQGRGIAAAGTVAGRLGVALEGVSAAGAVSPAAAVVAARTLIMEWQWQPEGEAQHVRRWWQGNPVPSWSKPEPWNQEFDITALRRGRPMPRQAQQVPHADMRTLMLAQLSTGAPADVALFASPRHRPERLTLYLLRPADKADSRLRVRVYEQAGDNRGQTIARPIVQLDVTPRQLELGETIPVDEDPWDFTAGRVEIEILP